MRCRVSLSIRLCSDASNGSEKGSPASDAPCALAIPHDTVVSMKAKAADDGPSTPFERFDTLARKLFAVPKKELDDELAKYNKAKAERIQKRRH